tara:strand:- start:1594 stop:1938 length:345 start_codon:yes stop_codon:yes gene_type:complete
MASKISCPSHNGSKKRDYECEKRQRADVPKKELEEKKRKHADRSRAYRRQNGKKGDGKDNHSPSGHRKNNGKTVSVSEKDNKNYWDENRSDKEEIKKKISASLRANRKKQTRKS